MSVLLIARTALATNFLKVLKSYTPWEISPHLGFITKYKKKEERVDHLFFFAIHSNCSRRVANLYKSWPNTWEVAQLQHIWDPHWKALCNCLQHFQGECVQNVEKRGTGSQHEVLRSKPKVAKREDNFSLSRAIESFKKDAITLWHEMWTTSLWFWNPWVWLNSFKH